MKEDIEYYKNKYKFYKEQFTSLLVFSKFHRYEYKKFLESIKLRWEIEEEIWKKACGRIVVVNPYNKKSISKLKKLVKFFDEKKLVKFPEEYDDSLFYIPDPNVEEEILNAIYEVNFNSFFEFFPLNNFFPTRDEEVNKIIREKLKISCEEFLDKVYNGEENVEIPKLDSFKEIIELLISYSFVGEIITKKEAEKIINLLIMEFELVKDRIKFENERNKREGPFKILNEKITTILKKMEKMREEANKKLIKNFWEEMEKMKEKKEKNEIKEPIEILEKMIKEMRELNEKLETQNGMDKSNG